MLTRVKVCQSVKKRGRDSRVEMDRNGGEKGEIEFVKERGR